MGGQVLTSEGKTCPLRTSFTNNLQMAIYAAGLLYQVGVPHGEAVREWPVVKVVRYGLAQHCFPDEHTVELYEKQIARYNEHLPEPMRPPWAE